MTGIGGVMNVVRWIVFIPAGILTWMVVAWGIGIIAGVQNVLDPARANPLWWTQLFQSGLAGYAATFVAAGTAPSAHGPASVVFVVLLTVFYSMGFVSTMLLPDMAHPSIFVLNAVVGIGAGVFVSVQAFAADHSQDATSGQHTPS